MAKTLKISENLSLPIEAVTEKLAFLGRTGTGKTYAAMKLAELMLEAGAQVVALDFVGKWYGLRVAGPGDPFPIPVFGGLHGDYPLESTGGKLMADLLVDRAISAVIDVSQFTRGEQVRFCLDFATQFFQRKKSNPTAVHLFLEECQEVLPQNAQPNESQMLGAFERIWKLGRNFGIGGSLISQRPQEVNKKALNMSGTLFVFQMTGPQERKTAEQWVSAQGINEDIGDVLPRLTKGRPHVWSVAFDKPISMTCTIAQKRTADVSATPTVNAGQRKERPLTPIDAKELAEAMAATVERSKAEDPKELRRKVADLERQLKQKNEVEIVPTGRKTNDGIKTPSKILTEKDRELLERLAAKFEAFEAVIRKESEGFRKSVETKVIAACNTATMDMEGLLERGRSIFAQAITLGGFATVIEKLKQVSVSEAGYKITTPQSRPPAQVIPKATTIRQVNGADFSDSALGKVHRAFLTVLANRQGKTTTRNQLAVFSGYSATSRHVDNTISACRTAGWLAGESSRLTITDAGLSALGPFDELPTGEALRNYWIRETGAAPGAMLRALCQVYPKSLTRDQVAEVAGYSVTSRHVDNSLSYLRTLELINGSRESLTASEELFG